MGPMLALFSAITPSELQDSKDFKLGLHPLVRRLGSLSDANKVRNFWSVLEPEMVTSKHKLWGFRCFPFSHVFPSQTPKRYLGFLHHWETNGLPNLGDDHDDDDDDDDFLL